MQHGTPTEEVIDRSNNFPYIMSFSEDDSDIPAQHFVVIEQLPLIECRGYQTAIFVLIAVHFVFNIEYHVHVKDVLYFLQDKVMGFNDPKYRKSPMYSNVSSAIMCYLPDVD